MVDSRCYSRKEEISIRKTEDGRENKLGEILHHLLPQISTALLTYIT